MTSLLIGLCGACHHAPSLVAAQTAVVQSASPIPGFADSLDQIRNLLDRGRGIEAENVARALLARVESLRGRDALEVAEVLDLLGRAVRRSAKVKEEEKTSDRRAGRRHQRKVLGPAHPDLATSLINLGVQRALSGDPPRATVARARAGHSGSRVRSRTPLVAAALQSLGGVLMTLRDDAGAKALLERAQQIRETVYGADHPDTIRTLVNLAIFYQETGDYSGARQRYERALALAEKIDGPADLLTLHVLTGAAVVLERTGR